MVRPLTGQLNGELVLRGIPAPLGTKDSIGLKMEEAGLRCGGRGKSEISLSPANVL